MEGDTKSRTYHPELQADKAIDALDIFADNLCHSDRGIRASTLRILCHYETLNCNICTEDEPVAKKMRTEVSPTCHVDNQGFNVCFCFFMLCLLEFNILYTKFHTDFGSNIRFFHSFSQSSQPRFQFLPVGKLLY